MNLDELRAVQDREREKDSLQHLRDSFYEEVGSYVSDLRSERERRAERAEDPFADPEVRRLTDEIQSAEEVAESIYERRMGKLVKTASLAAAGYAAETEGLTTEEADLFEDLVARIEANQSAVLEVLSGGDRSEFDAEGRDTGGAAGASDASGTGASDAGESAAGDDGDDGDRPPAPPADGGPEGPADVPDSEDATGGDDPGSGGHSAPAADDPPVPPETPERSPSEAAAATAESDDAGGFDAAAVMGDDDRVTLRITEDVGEIVGVDGTAYDLAVDDVVTLPEENAMPLVEKDAATRLD